MTRTLYSISAVLLLAGACKQADKPPAGEAKPASEAKPGAAAGDIVLGILADLTGATADVGKPYNEGMLAYIDHLNSEGGIKGKKINALSEDYAYKVPNAEE